MRESEELMRECRSVATASLERVLAKRTKDWQHIKGVITDDLARFIYRETKRKPMILPVIMDI